MKFIITENKLERAAIHWMNQNFNLDQLEVVKHSDYPNSIFYKKNGKVVMERDKKNKDFWFDYDEIWSFFESFFGFNYEEIQVVLTKWLEETLKLKGYTPINAFLWDSSLLEETLKLNKI